VVFSFFRERVTWKKSHPLGLERVANFPCNRLAPTSTRKHKNYLLKNLTNVRWSVYYVITKLKQRRNQMGYWTGTVIGDLEGKGLVWGDQPADIVDDAIERAINVFEDDLGRKPTKAELREGLEFYLRVRDDLQEK
jgi:hypothetical protein